MEQESPPAWTQEAYRPLCSKYSLCCPNWVPPGGTRGGYRVPPRVPPRGGTWVTPLGGYLGNPPWVPPGGVPGTPPGYPPWGYLGTPPGYPPGGGVPGTPPGYPPRGGTGYPPRCGQTNKVKLLPSRRTTYAGGKKGKNQWPYLPGFGVKFQMHRD